MNTTTVTGIVGVINPTPDIVRFINADGVAVLTIRHDGRIEIPADIDPSEAGRLAAEMMGAQLATMIRAAVEAEREACAVRVETLPDRIATTAAEREVCKIAAAGIRARKDGAR